MSFRYRHFHLFSLVKLGERMRCLTLASGTITLLFMNVIASSKDTGECALSIPLNSNVSSGLTFSIGTTLTYSCLPGFVFVNTRSRYMTIECENNELGWIPKPEDCIRVRCNVQRLRMWVKNINAVMNISDTVVESGDKVKINCYHKYYLYPEDTSKNVQEEVIIGCNTRGLWDGLDKLLEYKKYKCLSQSCTLPLIPNSKPHINDATAEYSYCKPAIVECKRCFEITWGIRTNNTRAEIPCLDMEQHLSENISCTKQMCPSLTHILGEGITINDTRTECDTRVRATCNNAGDSFTNLQDSTTFICEGKQWEPKPMPCRKRCKEINSENAITHNSQGTEVNRKFLLVCKNKFIFADGTTSTEVTCFPNQTWSKIPNCEPTIGQNQDFPPFGLTLLLAVSLVMLFILVTSLILYVMLVMRVFGKHQIMQTHDTSNYNYCLCAFNKPEQIFSQSKSAEILNGKNYFGSPEQIFSQSKSEEISNGKIYSASIASPLPILKNPITVNHATGSGLLPTVTDMGIECSENDIAKSNSNELSELATCIASRTKEPRGATAVRYHVMPQRPISAFIHQGSRDCTRPITSASFQVADDLAELAIGGQVMTNDDYKWSRTGYSQDIYF